MIIIYNRNLYEIKIVKQIGRCRFFFIIVLWRPSLSEKPQIRIPDIRMADIQNIPDIRQTLSFRRISFGYPADGGYRVLCFGCFGAEDFVCVLCLFTLKHDSTKYLYSSFGINQKITKNIHRCFGRCCLQKRTIYWFVRHKGAKPGRGLFV